MKKISCVIMDWAGTAVDFGCFAPLNAFLKVFSEEKGIDITYRQAREPMGLLKIYQGDPEYAGSKSQISGSL